MTDTFLFTAAKRSAKTANANNIFVVGKLLVLTGVVDVDRAILTLCIACEISLKCLCDLLLSCVQHRCDQNVSCYTWTAVVLL